MMIRPRLFIKVFFSYIVLLVITEVLIFAVFRYVSIDAIHRDFHDYLEDSSRVLKNMVEESMRSAPGKIRDQGHAIHRFIGNLGKISRSMVWLSSPDNEIISRSFGGDPPPVDEKEMSDAGRFKYIHSFKKKPVVYLKLPVNFPDGRDGHLEIYNARERPPFHEKRFLVSLGIIGAGIALLLYPLTLLAVGPLRKMTETVRKISGGDLKQRVPVRSRDEMGELAGAFNVMAGKVEEMIRGTRELSANISHELRSPLARLRVAIEILHGGGAAVDEPEKSRLVASLEEEIEEMDRLIGKILMLSKPDYVTGTAEKRDVDVAGLMRDIFTRYAPMAAVKGITLRESYGDAGAITAGNEEDLRTAITALADNAVKFTPPGGTIDVALIVRGGSIMAEIFNTCAVPPVEDLNVIFEPFRRLNGSGEPGTGLGLAVAKKIITGHGGEVGAALRDGGLMVSFHLPARPS